MDSVEEPPPPPMSTPLPMPRATFGTSRWRFGLLLLASLGFVASAVVALRRAPDQALLAWSTIVFFGGGAGVLLWELLDRRPRLVIDEQGILDRTIGVGLIRWEDIEGAHVKSLSGNDFICLELRDPQAYLGRPGRRGRLMRAMRSANQALGFTEFNVNLTGLPVGVAEVFELVVKRLEAGDRLARG